MSSNLKLIEQNDANCEQIQLFIICPYSQLFYRVLTLQFPKSIIYRTISQTIPQKLTICISLFSRNPMNDHLIISRQILNSSTQLPHHQLNNQHSNQQSDTPSNPIPFEYSLNEHLSLHSYMSSNQIQDIKFTRNDSSSSQSYSQFGSPFVFFKTNSISSESQFPLLSPSLNKSETTQESPGKQFYKNKNKEDLFQSNDNKTIQNKRIEYEDSSKKGPQKERKSYTSYLHEVVDKNHLQSPCHKLAIEKEKNSDFFEFKLEVADDQPNQEPKPQINIFKGQLSNPSSSSPQNQRNKSQTKPRIVAQGQKRVQKQSSDSSKPSPTHKPQHHRVQIRKIPQTLDEPYDQLMLSINKNEKPLGSDQLISPIKLKKKQNPHKKSKDSDQKQIEKSQDHQNYKNHNISTKLIKNNHDQELLVNLPIIEGFCQLRTSTQSWIETRFVINKNQILFQTSKTLTINNITKLKFIQKDEQLSIKISYQAQKSKASQTIIIKVLSPSKKVYFHQSYEVFSQIILRRLLLMKLYINEVNEKIQNQSPIRSFQSSPVSSPVSSHVDIPTRSTGKVSQDISTQIPDQNIFSSQLFKKAALFNSWEKKYFVLTRNDLQSFSSCPQQGEKAKPSSTLHKTSEVWTRFELIYGYLVFKMWQNKIQKVQIGIPLCDFTNPEGKKNWLYGLSKYIAWKRT